MSRILVTITPPTPNGGLHLGHLAGPFLAADVFARTQRQRGHDTVLVCYSDDHQSYLARKARELGQTEISVCTRYAQDIATTLERADIALDYFLSSRDHPVFKRIVGEHVELLRRQGALTQERLRVPYCEHCALYGYEAYARGQCNHCGALSDASQCEACAGAPDVEKMQDLRCTQCQQSTSWREVVRWVFDLGLFRERLIQAHAQTPMRPALKQFIDHTLQHAPLRWPITRPHEHGVPVMVEGEPEIVHTWFSGLAGYMACLESHAAVLGQPDITAQYLDSPDTVFAHFLGFDCAFSHALAYRAILLARPASAQAQALYYTNAFLKLDNTDFSTSRGHAIWAKDTLDTVEADLLRYYLSRVCPETQSCNFDSADFASWLPLARERLAQCTRDAAIAQQQVALNAIDFLPLLAWRERWQAASSMATFSVRDLALIIDETMLLACHNDRSWGTLKPGQVLAALAGFSLSIMPTFANTLLAELSLDEADVNAWLHATPPDSASYKSHQTSLAGA